MAKSPAHQFGQEIGHLLEEIIKPTLSDFARARGLFLDSKGPRGAARAGRKVTWTDKYGNDHDLDFVIERGGSADLRGRPLAFIESAWRRYTKHSRNKAQEIQGALLPIAEKHAWDAPFKGVILAGVFTTGSIAQLESAGFVVLHFDYKGMKRAFASVGIAIDFNEDTPDTAFGRALRALNRLTPAQRERLKTSLREANRSAISSFMEKLSRAIARHPESIVITPYFGLPREFDAVAQAISFLQSPITPPANPSPCPNKIEVGIRFSDGTRIDGSFVDANRALEFIRYATQA